MRIQSVTTAALFAFASIFTSFSARAETFTFSASGNGFGAFGNLTGIADPTVPGAFDITGGSGQVNGVPLTLFNPGGTAATPIPVTFTNPPDEYNAFYIYDDVVYTNGTALDADGLLFSDNGDHTNLFFENGSFLFVNDESYGGFSITFSLTDTTPVTTPTSITPEPSSIALLGTGLLGVVSTLRRRKV